MKNITPPKNITLPRYVRQVLVVLEARGYGVYIVGGNVRDLLLNIQPNQWDICTSASVKEILSLFPGARLYDEALGIVAVPIGKNVVFVDSINDDKKSEELVIDAVSSMGNLTDELSSRDFTMDAMALTPSGVIYDPFDGRIDMARKTIRCVGDPVENFAAEPVRMFRAFFFAAKLGFGIDEQTHEAIEKNAALAAGIRPERVRNAIEKLLLSPRPELLGEVIRCGLMKRYLKTSELDEMQFMRLASLPKKSLYRWAGLCCILRQAGAIDSADAFLSSLKLDNRTIRCAQDCCTLIERPAPEDPVAWKKLLRSWGIDTVDCMAACRDAICGGSRRRELKAILKSGECFTMRHLALNGDDLTALGYKGRMLGDMLNFLLDYVIEYPENNRREVLLSLVSAVEE